MIDILATGGRRIFLLLPFKHGRKTIKSITLRPVMWDHALKWQEGEYTRSLDLLFDIAEESPAAIRQLRYPDVDRVMDQFFAMLPPEIRNDIASGTTPKKVDVGEFAAVSEPAASSEPSDDAVIPDEDMGEPIPEEAYVDETAEPKTSKFTPIPVTNQEEHKEFGFEGV